MQFEENKTAYLFGKCAGYIFGYAIFTTLLFLVLTFTHKIPDSWNIIHIIVITLSITLLGTILNKWLG